MKIKLLKTDVVLGEALSRTELILVESSYVNGLIGLKSSVDKALKRLVIS